ncbi:MAG TPA: NADH-quinone oxidoreductase subunit NuoG [Solirubrobacteraceae bacterium]|nr:NADH-quinone oxidoreductase subunit NuoG [Solirubrobacteraceae bacterium]
MPRPQQNIITLTIDGREIEAIEGSMLVDAAKQGDVEIPYFCYEPKLGEPVGACRMCLVEIEGIPKLQTSCSTPVKDGMVVHTQTDRVREAQNAVVEFLLINHPLDCPVCDKGGECPLQDITFGWGRGISRMVEPKRHFQKPLALSPLVAIDRERCILCYRCVRFSQEISEDYQLIFTERGAHTYVGTHDGHPYVAPFSGNIIELCPVGALTSQPYRFRARPWDNESAGSVCTLCPAQCNVTFTVRDERAMRVLARDYEGNKGVDDGWLCDKGRFAYQAIHSDERITRPLVRDGGELREVSWERAMETARGLAKHPGRTAALLGGGVSNEEGFLLQKVLREGLRSGDIDSRGGGEISSASAGALAAPGLQASVPDIEFAHTVLLLGVDPLEDAPILDLRIRKGVRRNGVVLAVATARPTHLEQGASHIARYAPGRELDFLDALHRTIAGEDDPTRPVGQTVSDLATQLREGGEDVVILYSERLSEPAAALIGKIAGHLGLDGRDGAGVIAIPAGANGRGLREAGAVPDAGPGYAPVSEPGRSAAQIAQAAVDGEVTALWLVQTDPVRDLENRELWEQALHSAGLVVAHASVLTEGLREHANVIFPAESHAEKEGTVVHPDGRLQRLRIAIQHPGDVRPGWAAIAELGHACGLDMPYRRSADVFEDLVAAVPFYAGITLDEIGGTGVRWPTRAAASALPTGGGFAPLPATSDTLVPQATNGHLALGTYRPLWAAPEVEISPALQYLVPRQSVELSPADASLRGIADGEQVVVSQNGTRLTATAVIRSNIPDGAAFLADGIADGSANALTGRLIEVVKVG